jgi:hypothetical protein
MKKVRTSISSLSILLLRHSVTTPPAFLEYDSDSNPPKLRIGMSDRESNDEWFAAARAHSQINSNSNKNSPRHRPTLITMLSCFFQFQARRMHGTPVLSISIITCRLPSAFQKIQQEKIKQRRGKMLLSN